ncbi:hypothetical protein LTV02_33490 [Nocardia yamanashiensis]|uniref:hypothetical protein n=1 Tax=Nocardia yamanashiensis TaxID=209247 RepID=UPI001E5F4689|nr:hypothetical protein [Nocardia yamanashiensis]UGT40842.1 hypothetical protein LTV02_33490 [Nocardia yamanashiensis]
MSSPIQWGFTVLIHTSQQPRDRRWRLILGLVAALTVATGAAILITVRHSEPAEAAGMSNRGGFADLRRLDPCSYVDPAALGKYTATTSSGRAIRIEPDGFDACAVELPDSPVTTPGQTVIVALQSLQATAADLAATPGVLTTGKTTVRTYDQPDSAPQYCHQLIAREDGVAVRLSITAFAVKGPGDRKTLCELRTAVATMVGRALTEGGGATIDYPPNSLGGKDLCGRLLDSEIATPTPDSVRTRKPRSGMNRCTWTAGESTTTAATDLVRTSAVAVHGTVTPLVGRQSDVVRTFDGTTTPTCIVTTYGRTWQPWQGSHFNYAADADDAASNFTERATVQVRLAPGGSADDACNMAQTTAVMFWQHLPSS